jgi:hypothetical protein
MKYPVGSCVSAHEYPVLAVTGQDGAVAERGEFLPVAAGIPHPEGEVLGAASVLRFGMRSRMKSRADLHPILTSELKPEAAFMRCPSDGSLSVLVEMASALIAFQANDNLPALAGRPLS